MMQTFQDLDFEKKSTEHIKSVQNQLLRESIQYAVNNSPYYRDLFKKNSISPEDIREVGDLARLPMTHKDILRERNWDFLAAPRTEIREIVSTTGTTGFPIFLAMTRNDLNRLGYNEQRSFLCADTAPNDVYQLAVTMDNLFIAGLAYYLGITGLGTQVIRVGPQNSRRHLELMQELGVTGIVAVPSFMLHLYKEMQKIELSVSDFKLKKAILIGDTIREPDFSSNTLGWAIEDQWQIPCYSTYGFTEGAISYCECGEHRGLHEHSDLIVSEIVDSDGNPLPEGEVGELLITTLGVEGMPLIRYQTGDITFMISEPCKCGRNSSRLGPILGRKDHKLKLKGTTVYPQNIINALYEIPAIENYILEAYKGDDFADFLVVRVGCRQCGPELLKLIQHTIKAKARVTPHIEICDPEAIKQLQWEGNPRKPLTFIDRRGDKSFAHRQS
ncbi:MAG: phenylacetate--CoA ligase family protein [bacterium]